jgi:hypothetical protein
MSDLQVNQKCESTQILLSKSIGLLESFLNQNALPQLIASQDVDMDEFYLGYLNDMRHLLVFSQVGYEKIGVCLRRPEFHVEFSEKVLYEIYHTCVNAFFYTKHECYSEDGRYAYTGGDAIRFRKKPSRVVRDLTIELFQLYEQLREELAYYETEYVNQRRLQGGRV